MTKFLDKSFSTYAPGGTEYADRWEETFGKRTPDDQRVDPKRPVSPEFLQTLRDMGHGELADRVAAGQRTASPQTRCAECGLAEGHAASCPFADYETGEAEHPPAVPGLRPRRRSASVQSGKHHRNCASFTLVPKACDCGLVSASPSPATQNAPSPEVEALVKAAGHVADEYDYRGSSGVKFDMILNLTAALSPFRGR